MLILHNQAACSPGGGLLATNNMSQEDYLKEQEYCPMNLYLAATKLCAEG